MRDGQGRACVWASVREHDCVIGCREMKAGMVRSDDVQSASMKHMGRESWVGRCSFILRRSGTWISQNTRRAPQKQRNFNTSTSHQFVPTRSGKSHKRPGHWSYRKKSGKFLLLPTAFFGTVIVAEKGGGARTVAQTPLKDTSQRAETWISVSGVSNVLA